MDFSGVQVHHGCPYLIALCTDGFVLVIVQLIVGAFDVLFAFDALHCGSHYGHLGHEMTCGRLRLQSATKAPLKKRIRAYLSLSFFASHDDTQSRPERDDRATSIAYLLLAMQCLLDGNKWHFLVGTKGFFENCNLPDRNALIEKGFGRF